MILREQPLYKNSIWPCDYHWTHIGVIYSPDASTVQTLGILQKSKDRPTDRPTERPTGAKEGGGTYKIKWICYINAFPCCFHWTSKLKKKHFQTFIYHVSKYDSVQVVKLNIFYRSRSTQRRVLPSAIQNRDDYSLHNWRSCT